MLPRGEVIIIGSGLMKGGRPPLSAHLPREVEKDTTAKAQADAHTVRNE